MVSPPLPPLNSPPRTYDGVLHRRSDLSPKNAPPPPMRWGPAPFHYNCVVTGAAKDPLHHPPPLNLRHLDPCDLRPI